MYTEYPFKGAYQKAKAALYETCMKMDELLNTAVGLQEIYLSNGGKETIDW